MFAIRPVAWVNLKATVPTDLNPLLGGQEAKRAPCRVPANLKLLG
jgi:hypothetical protein